MRWAENFWHGLGERYAGGRSKNPCRSRNLSRRSTSLHRKRRTRKNQAHRLSASSISCDERTFEICLRTQIGRVRQRLFARQSYLRPNVFDLISFPRATGKGHFQKFNANRFVGVLAYIFRCAQSQPNVTFFYECAGLLQKRRDFRARVAAT